MCPARVEAGDDVIFQALHDELVLLNMKSQEYFGLDDVGSEMWNLLIEHGDLEVVTSLLAGKYDVDPQTVRRDLIGLVERLLETGLLKPGVVPEATPNKR